MVETDDIAQFKGLILAQQEEITALKAVIADLMARLAQNSANFHKPPSSDGLTKKPLLTAALPKQAGKKPGGQPRYPGNTLHFVVQPDRIHVHQPTQCQCYGLAFQIEGQIPALKVGQPRMPGFISIIRMNGRNVVDELVSTKEASAFNRIPKQLQTTCNRNHRETLYT